MASLAQVGLAAMALPLQVPCLLDKTPPGTVQRTWRTVVLPVVGVLTVWAMRSPVRLKPDWQWMSRWLFGPAIYLVIKD